MAKKTTKEHEEDSTKEADKPAEVAETNKGSAKKHEWFNKWWNWAKTHKLISIPVAIILTMGLITALIPQVRYSVLGLFFEQSFPVVVVDAETGKPVSSATVSLGGKTATTDSEGRASVKTSVGYADLVVSKKYYHSFSKEVVVPLAKPDPLKVSLKADGRAVPVTVLNKISKEPAENVTITYEGTEAKTDSDGKATVVVPADKKDVKIMLGGDGFVTSEATLTVTSDEVEANIFQVSPSGKIYFLSNASGKIDLVKSNLDGSDRQTVLAGTGKEDRFGTVLLASRDWKYIALLSKRDGGEYAKLFLIDTTNNDSLTTMDEGQAYFTPYGWSNDRFIYKVNRQNIAEWQPKRQALKSYNAPGKKITTLDETDGSGNAAKYAYEAFDNVYILDKEIVYSGNWNSGGYYYNPGDQGKATFNSVQADGSQKKVVKTFNDDPYIETRTGDFGEIKILYVEGGAAKVDVYHNGKVSVGASKSEEFYDESYPTFIVSPTGKKTLWSDYRDGKYVFFVGDSNGENGKQIGSSPDFTVYGWYSDDYILLTKKGSELHIMPADGLEGGVEASLKATDYYKPNYYREGFGYGYGG
jgi:Tol biopolymer transport system component